MKFSRRGKKKVVHQTVRHGRKGKPSPHAKRRRLKSTKNGRVRTGGKRFRSAAYRKGYQAGFNESYNQSYDAGFAKGLQEGLVEPM